jgi:phytoene dehydrogenase-like protein
MEKEKSIIIIGAGFAGLATGIYARLNGYDTQIFEMHDKPGGLCTSWERKGFTIDGCIHWLVGSSPRSQFHDYWEELGLVQNREFINMDEYMRIEGSDGRTLILYTDLVRLEKHLLQFSPADAGSIKEFIDGIKMCLPFDLPSKNVALHKRLINKVSLIFNFIIKGKKMKKWMNVTCEEFAGRFKDPLMRDLFENMWLPEFSMFFMLFTFAWLHRKNAGYPVGGSMPMSLALESRYKSLGGIIHYNKKVEKIIVENDTAVGIRLDDGSEYKTARVISSADGFNTIFKMLEGKYIDDKIKEPYEKWKLFPPLIYIGLGVNRTFEEVPLMVSGFSYQLKETVEIANEKVSRLSVHLYHHDPTLAPAGKTSVTVMLQTNYDYWKNLAEDRKSYKKKKDEIGNQVVELLEQRFPGINSQVEMINVATPMTFERYTGNWKGSFEGWLITPENSSVIMKPMSQVLPELRNFYLCGQWVEPGGGLPSGVISARRLMKRLCKEDGGKFKA